MRRCRGNQHNVFTGQDAPVPMHDGDARQGPPLPRFRNVALDFGFGHARIVFECQRCYRFAILDAAANSGECNQRADITTAARKLGRFHGGIKRLALQSHCGCHLLNVARRRWRGYPPVMGGKKAISRASLIAELARTCFWSTAARMTFALLNACAYSSPREASQVISSATVAMPGGISIVSSGLPMRSRTHAK